MQGGGILGTNCGIVEVKLKDPVSNLINIIHPTKYNGVGIYLSGKILLYNTIDDQSRLCTSKDLANEGGAIIMYYPAKSAYEKIFKDAFNNPYVSDSSNLNTYIRIWSLLVGGNNIQVTTGYTIINGLFNEKGDSELSRAVVYSCKESITTNSTNSLSAKNTINDYHQGLISTLSEAFIFCYTNEEKFRTRVTGMSLGKSLSALMTSQQRLISYLSSSISTGDINIDYLNDFIESVNNERTALLPKEEVLSLIINHNGTINITDDTKEEENPVDELRYYIKNILRDKTPLIDITRLIDIYNKMSDIQIEKPKVTVPINATLVTPNYEEELVSAVNLPGKTITELKSILQYLDAANKHKNLQNLIISEISHRSIVSDLSTSRDSL